MVTGRANAPAPSPVPLREVEAQGLELDREIDVLEPHVPRDLDPARREVQDGLDSGGDQLVDHALGGLGGYRDDGELQVPPLHLAREVAHRENRDAVHGFAPLALIVVEDPEDPEALLGEALVVEERRAEVPEPDERDLPLPIEPQDALELGL